jgi:hypothetical protein
MSTPADEGILAAKIDEATRPLIDTLRRIAEHYEHCDLSNDQSSRFVVNTACAALGWKATYGEDGELSLLKLYPAVVNGKHVMVTIPED